MDQQELLRTFNLMIDDASVIVQNQQVFSQIKTELDTNIRNPFEQDYIYLDHFGSKPAEPRSFFHNGVLITTQVLHQTGIRLSDIKGADLLYEIVKEKFAIVQYKAASMGRVKNDSIQLDKLLDRCPDACYLKRKRPLPASWIPVRLNGLCGCWYCVFENGTRKYVHACEAEAIYEKKKSASSRKFNHGLRHEVFVDLFSSCRIGAPLQKVNEVSLSGRYVDQLLDESHLVYWIRQDGRW